MYEAGMHEYNVIYCTYCMPRVDITHFIIGVCVCVCVSELFHCYLHFSFSTVSRMTLNDVQTVEDSYKSTKRMRGYLKAKR